jgi:hypothetical protein
MKALSVLQPGGSRIASGEKTVEMRGWKPDLKHGEDLLIVESHQPLLEDSDTDLNGRIVAVVKVKAVRPFTTADMARACALVYEDGQFAWELTDIQAVRPPYGPVLAARKIYELDISLDALAQGEVPVRRSA